MKRMGLLLAAALFSAPTIADDLLGVLRKAREHDNAFAAARANRDALVEKEAQGQSQLLPTVAFSVGRTRTDQQVTPSIPGGRYNYSTDSYGLTLTQPLYRRQNFASYSQGKADAARAEYDFLAAEQELMTRTAQTYFNVLAAQDVLDYAQLEKLGVARLLNLARRSFNVGNASLADVHDAQAREDLAIAQEIAAVNDLETRREALRVIVRDPPGELARLGATPELRKPDPDDVEKWAAAARRDNPLVKARELALESAKEELEKNRGGHHPTLDLTASRTYSDAGGGLAGIGYESTANQIGVVLNVPIYQGGNVSSKVREAYARREEAQQKLEQAQRESAQKAREAYLAVLNGMARVRALDQAQVSNQRALETTLLGYERGVRNGIDVLNAQREIFRTRRDFAQARYDYLTARLRLKAAVGRLSEDDLAQTSQLLSLSAPNPGTN
jgi:outer membrane protein